MGQSVTRLMQLVSPITILMLKVGYAPLTLMPILVMTKKPVMFLRISFDYLPDVIEDLVTLSILDELQALEAYGDGSNTKA
jgi:hypothetical protein